MPEMRSSWTSSSSEFCAVGRFLPRSRYARYGIFASTYAPISGNCFWTAAFEMAPVCGSPFMIGYRFSVVTSG